MSKTVVVGSRGSRLARSMVRELLEPLKRAYPGVVFKHKTVMTAGDRDRTTDLRNLAATPGVFAKQIEIALLAGEIDVALHSLKDLATTPTDGTLLAAVPLRADPRDALCGSTLRGLPHGARVGTGSPRRIAQLKALRPDLSTVPIRGNVPPRLRKARDMDLDAVILAAAGLHRLGLSQEITEALDIESFPPSPAQGVLGVQIRKDSTELHDLLSTLHDQSTDYAVKAERSLLAALHGGCSVPVGAFADVRSGQLHLSAQVTSLDGTTVIRATRSCALHDADDLGKQSAYDLLDQGAEQILSTARETPSNT
ncbi:hydroxymethylbilane synthase [Nocardiopsis mwathae]|uniref:Porphobilinogen deaminase n=1 Tax=Nocardiopsis mwathae TaxID=1472723 RepID=A0A7W9YJP0_9ACTN|nr:hydroxymethylbilane synthase [Nocardiopsis mwathae]MBB6173205.1 hydroxymethylbilane synthase [Nocardiopsis mwathae]